MHVSGHATQGNLDIFSQRRFARIGTDVDVEYPPLRVEEQRDRQALRGSERTGDAAVDVAVAGIADGMGGEERARTAGGVGHVEPEERDPAAEAPGGRGEQRELGTAGRTP